MKTITIVSEDRVGLLADISYVLGKAKVNILSISVDALGGKSVVTLAVQNPLKAKEVLEASGYKIAEANAVVVKLDDIPGELGRITGMLANNGVNIENVHTLSRDGKSTILALSVDKPVKAAGILKDYMIKEEK